MKRGSDKLPIGDKLAKRRRTDSPNRLVEYRTAADQQEAARWYQLANQAKEGLKTIDSTILTKLENLLKENKSHDQVAQSCELGIIACQILETHRSEPHTLGENAPLRSI